jgi:hypothetical protein
MAGMTIIQRYPPKTDFSVMTEIPRARPSTV